MLRIKPSKIGIELRIYQNDEVVIFEPEVKEIKAICDKIVEFDKVLTEFDRVIS